MAKVTKGFSFWNWETSRARNWELRNSPLPTAIVPAKAPSVPQVFFRLISQGDDLFRPPPQQHAFLCEDDAVFAPVEQGYAQFFFQLDQLPGQGRLAQMQQAGCLCDVLFPGNHQKIVQNTDLHKTTPPICFQG